MNAGYFAIAVSLRKRRFLNTQDLWQYSFFILKTKNRDAFLVHKSKYTTFIA